MTFDEIYNSALEIINKIVAEGKYVSPDDTVCAVCSRSGKLYTGVSHIEMINGMQNAVHAEIDAVRNMQKTGESIIDLIVLVNVSSRSPMLPCNNCISYIIMMNPENANGNIAMPDRMIRFSEANRFAGGQSMPFASANPMMSQPYVSQPYVSQQYVSQPYVSQPYVSQQIRGSVSVQAPQAISAKNDILKKRVNNIMGDSEKDDDIDEEVLNELNETLDQKQKKKKKFLGLF